MRDVASFAKREQILDHDASINNAVRNGIPWVFVTPKVMNLIRGKTKKERNYQGCGFFPIWIDDGDGVPKLAT